MKIQQAYNRKFGHRKQARRPHVSMNVRGAYLRKRFPLGTEETGHKLDAATVQRYKENKENEAGNRLFAVDEFLTPQQCKVISPEWPQSSRRDMTEILLKKT